MATVNRQSFTYTPPSQLLEPCQGVINAIHNSEVISSCLSQLITWLHNCITTFAVTMSCRKITVRNHMWIDARLSPFIFISSGWRESLEMWLQKCWSSALTYHQLASCISCLTPFSGSSTSDKGLGSGQLSHYIIIEVKDPRKII